MPCPIQAQHVPSQGSKQWAFGVVAKTDCVEVSIDCLGTGWMKRDISSLGTLPKNSQMFHARSFLDVAYFLNGRLRTSEIHTQGVESCN
jgi:hypothetical protein